MLAVLLKILSIIGIILLVLLGIVMVLILLILFVPVFYRAEGRKNVEVMEAEAKVSWLGGLVRGIVRYQNGLLIQAKVLCFALYDSTKEKTPKEQGTGGRRGKRRRKSQDIPKEQTAEAALPPGDETMGDEPDPSDAMERPQQETFRTEEGVDFLSKIEKIKYTIRSVYGKIKDISEDVGYYRSILDDPDTRGLLNHVFFRLGKILKLLRPGKARGDVLFGTGSPDTTGYLFGVYGMLSPHLGKDFGVTPDFTRAVLEGELELAGHVCVFPVLVQGLKIVFDRRLRIFLDKIKEKP